MDPLLQPGVRVRITAPEATPRIGRLSSVDVRSLSLTGEESDPGETILWREIQRVEVSQGRARGLWSMGGILLGGVAGIILTRATNESDPADIGGWGATADGINNMLTGVLVGGVVGWFLAPERWTAVNRPPAEP